MGMAVDGTIFSSAYLQNLITLCESRLSYAQFCKISLGAFMVIGTVNSATMEINYEDMCILQFGQSQ